MTDMTTNLRRLYYVCAAVTAVLIWVSFFGFPRENMVWGAIKGCAAAFVAEVSYKTFKEARKRYLWRRRSKEGTSTNLDANDLIYARWAPYKRADWNDTNGKVPYSQAQRVLNAIGPRPRISPTLVTRWIYTGEDPNLLPVFVQAGFTNTEISEFMHANPDDRAAIQVLAALAVGSKAS